MASIFRINNVVQRPVRFPILQLPRTIGNRLAHTHRPPKPSRSHKALFSVALLPISAAAALNAKQSSDSLPEKPETSNRDTMSSKLIPSNPDDVMVIRNITPNVVTCSVPFARFGIFRVGGRGTIVRLSSGSLAVFSPVALTENVKAKVAEMGGEVKYLIAPDIEHHIFLSSWKKEFPDAKLIGPEGLPDKRTGMKDPMIGGETFSVVMTPDKQDPKTISDEFAADFEVEYVHAHANKEIVLLYKPDKVLIQADLMFNLPAIEQYSKVPESQKKGHAMGNRFFESLSTTQGDAKNAKRTQWFMFSAGNRPAYNQSVKRIDSWDFDILIPCHGETIEQGAKDVFRKIFEWHLKAAE